MDTDLLNTLKAKRYNIPDKIEIYEMVVAEAERSTKDWSETEMKNLTTMSSLPSTAYIQSTSIISSLNGQSYYYPIGAEKNEGYLVANENSDPYSIIISPVPSIDYINVQTDYKDEFKVAIYNIKGLLVYTDNSIYKYKATIPIPNKENGTYILVSSDMEGRIISSDKFIIMK